MANFKFVLKNLVEISCHKTLYKKFILENERIDKKFLSIFTTKFLSLKNITIKDKNRQYI